MFGDRAGQVYTLTNSSSCAVDHSAGVGVSTDIEGIPRPQGSKYDAGAYETGFTATLSIVLDGPLDTGIDKSAVFVVTVYPPDAVVTYTWSIDGLQITNTNIATYSWSSSGFKSVEVIVTDGVTPPVPANKTIEVKDPIVCPTVVNISGKIEGFVGRIYTFTATPDKGTESIN
jgi:hypothetical protein